MQEKGLSQTSKSRRLFDRVTGANLPVIVNDERDCFEKDCVLGIGVLHFFRLGRLLGLVQNGDQTLVESPSNPLVVRGWVVLEQPE